MSYIARRRSQVGSPVALDARPLRSLRNRRSLIFVGALALAAIVRALTMGDAPLSYDEAGYALDGWRLLSGRVEPGAYFDAAPGYSQLLSVAMFLFGAADSSARALSVISGLLTILLCAPLARLIGRPAAVVAAVLFAVSPSWVRIHGTVTPEAPAAALAVFALALIASSHLWPWSLLGAAAVGGYLLSFGAPGVWLAGGVVCALVLVPRRYWQSVPIAGAVAAFVVASAAGLTAFFTEPVSLPGGRTRSGGNATLSDILREALLSTPALALIVGAIALALLSSRDRTPTSRRTSESIIGLVFTFAVVAVGLLLPPQFRPSPAVLLLPLTLLGAVVVARAFEGILDSSGAVMAGSAVALLLSLTLALMSPDGVQVGSVPGGLARVNRPQPAVRAALERVRKVSLELYSLERSLPEPRGGRRLKANVAPALANWGLWYLKDLENVTVSARDTGSPESIVLPGTRVPTPTGYVKEPLGAGNSADTGVTVLWSNSVWSRISPSAGSGVAKPKSQYDLFDMAPPGNSPGQLNSPVDMAISPDGMFYVVDQANGRVQKYDPKGRFLLQWGSIGDRDGQFAYSGSMLGATGIAASSEFVWVADTWNHRVQQFRPDGSFVRAWGSFKDTKGEPRTNATNPLVFYGPRSIAIGPDGNLYISDTGNKRVVVYTGDGRFVRQWGSEGADPAQLDEPVGVAVDRTGAVYVADARNARVQVFSSTGRPLRRWAVDGWSPEEGRLEPYVEVGPGDAVYVTDPSGPVVLKYTGQGRKLDEDSGDADRPLLSPLGLAVGTRGEVYVVDSGLSNVLHLESLR